MTEPMNGDVRAYESLLKDSMYAREQDGASFYNKMQRMLLRVQVKAKADVELIRFMLIDPTIFQSNIQACMNAFANNLYIILRISDFDLHEDIVNWLCDEYRVIFLSSAKVLDLRELVQFKFIYPHDRTVRVVEEDVHVIDTDAVRYLPEHVVEADKD